MEQTALKIGKRYVSVLLIGLSLLTVPTVARSEAPSPPAASKETGPGESLGISSVPNLRDLGGYKTGDGATVASGLVYRSNQLSDISPSDMKKLDALDLSTAFDLRTAAEREKRPDELPSGVDYVWLNVLADSPQAGPAQLEKLMQDPKEANAALGGGKAEQAFKASYREFVSLPSAKEEFGKLFRSLAEQKEVPAVFHCTTGKDRTGWAAAALLTLLGVPKDIVMQDYLRSNDYIIPAYQDVIDKFVAAGGDPAIPEAILGVKKEYLDAAFDEMKTKYGTIENYFSEGLGIDAAGQQALRDLYLVKEPAVQAETGGWVKDSVTDCAVWSTEKPRPEQGVSWTGACADSKASGRGALVWWDEKGLQGRYTGEMSAGKLNGEGRLFLRADDEEGFHEYVGRFADSKPVGTGFLKTAKGARFVGELIDGVRHGKGVLLTANGWLIKGEIKDGKGVGTLIVDYTTEDGQKYFGQVENGKRNGFGILRATDEDFYAGDFADGKPDGPGIYKGKAGDRYTGDFKDGKPNGFGTSIDVDGNVVQGRFVNGEPEGTLLVTEPDGTQSVTTAEAGSAQ